MTLHHSVYNQEHCYFHQDFCFQFSIPTPFDSKIISSPSYFTSNTILIHGYLSKYTNAVHGTNCEWCMITVCRWAMSVRHVSIISKTLLVALNGPSLILSTVMIFRDNFRPPPQQNCKYFYSGYSWVACFRSKATRWLEP